MGCVIPFCRLIGSSRLLCLAVLLCAETAPAARTPQAPMVPDGIGLPSTVVSQLEPMLVRLQVTNQAAHRVTIRPDEHGVRVERRTEHGQYEPVPILKRIIVCGLARPGHALLPGASRVLEVIAPREATAQPGTYRLVYDYVVEGAAGRDFRDSLSMTSVPYTVLASPPNVAAMRSFLDPENQVGPEELTRHLGTAAFIDIMTADLEEAELTTALATPGITERLRQTLRMVQAQMALRSGKYAAALTIAQGELAAGAPDSDCGSYLGRLTSIVATCNWHLAATQTQFDRVTADYDRFLAARPHMASSFLQYAAAPTSRRETLPP